MVGYGRPSEEIYTRLDLSVSQSGVRVALLQNMVGLNFGELRYGEVRRIPLLGTSVNKAKEKNRLTQAR